MATALAGSRRPRGFAWVVVALTFTILLVGAAVRSAPAVLIVPIETSFGWTRAMISLVAAVGVFIYGLAGPFAASLMRTLGIKRTMICGLLLICCSTLASAWMTQSWQYLLTWGVLSGLGTGAIAWPLGVSIVNRWFATRQGLVMGLLSASTATGSLVFIPAMTWLATRFGWQSVVLAVTVICAVLIPAIVWLVPERPEDVGLTRYGETAAAPEQLDDDQSSAWMAISKLRERLSSPMFWLLFGTFFVCGLTTNGLIGTHFIAYCSDHGMAATAAAGTLSLMGFFDLVGTTASGWFTDRIDPRKLLAAYYGLRGLSLIALPYMPLDQHGPLLLFAIFYGLDWVATVPPTVKLANEAFGERDAPILTGWIFAGHQLGAATAAIGAGLIRQYTGSYFIAFLAAGLFGLFAALLFLVNNRHRSPTLAAHA